MTVRHAPRLHSAKNLAMMKAIWGRAGVLFGIYRTLLAVAVIADHTAGLQGIGGPAVFGFFCLSGFLMTLLVTGPYAGRPDAFIANRFLRLYPMYLVAFLLVLLLWHIWSKTMPSNLSLLRQAGYVVRVNDLAIIPTAWAVTNEIVCYVMIAAGLTSTRAMASLSLLAAAAVTGCIYLTTPGTMIELYFPVVGALLPFALGGLLAQFRDVPAVSNRAALILIAACGILIVAGGLAIAHFFALGAHSHPLIMPVMYLSLVPMAGVVFGLYRIAAPTWLCAADGWIGQLSYPMYLTHLYMVGFGWMLLPDVHKFLSTLLLTVALSAIMVLTVSVPIDIIRRHIRRGAAVAAEPLGAILPA